MLEQQERSAFEPKLPRYWHQGYAETIGKEDLARWTEIDSIEYIGEFTDTEWNAFLKNCPRDQDNEPVISGKKITREGKPLD